MGPVSFGLVSMHCAKTLSVLDREWSFTPWKRDGEAKLQLKATRGRPEHREVLGCLKSWQSWQARAAALSERLER